MNSNPFKALLWSRKFWLAVFGVVQTVVLYYLDIPQDVWLSIDVLVGVVIAGITIEDSAEKSNTTRSIDYTER